ncbi:hypothetical protein C8J57DRAFT_1214107 [Mycena rebaudengoi]|nr:hypothetical protein C8J57DRAFT_1214107 [Mycena rebaudengoi]
MSASYTDPVQYSRYAVGCLYPADEPFPKEVNVPFDVGCSNYNSIANLDLDPWFDNYFSNAVDLESYVSYYPWAGEATIAILHRPYDPWTATNDSIEMATGSEYCGTLILMATGDRGRVENIRDREEADIVAALECSTFISTLELVTGVYKLCDLTTLNQCMAAADDLAKHTVTHLTTTICHVLKTVIPYKQHAPFFNTLAATSSAVVGSVDKLPPNPSGIPCTLTESNTSLPLERTTKHSPSHHSGPLFFMNNSSETTQNANPGLDSLASSSETSQNDNPGLDSLASS